MEIKIERIKSDDDSTISAIFIDDKFQCFGLEDEYREKKVIGKTRVPAGTYKIGLRIVGGFHNRYKVKFRDIHQGMLEVVDVPGFKYILIHVGNTHENTDGCLLVGVGANSRSGDMSIQSSVEAYKKLYVNVIEEAMSGDLTIKYVDRDLPSH